MSIEPCACIGPEGDCPCLRKQLGLSEKIIEISVSDEIFQCLDVKDQKALNELKVKALSNWLNKQNL